MKYIDLRSDTVTQPTDDMRAAMAAAEVGDDVFGDDPTLNKLEQRAAQLMGKEAGLFVTSGTQGNQLAIMTHTQRGDNIIIGRHCHIAEHEAGAYGMLSGVSAFFPDEQDGVMDPDSVAGLIRKESAIQVARTGLVCVENALSNGNVAPVANLREIYSISQASEIPVHLDGARIFNAATALSCSVLDIAKHADSVSFCLSKGLCAPVGSVLVGSKPFIKRARELRRILGGGMRQGGILAAAGLVALDNMTGRLQDDHDNALYLADRLEELPGVRVHRHTLKINLIFFSVDWPAAALDGYQAGMLKRGFKVEPAYKVGKGYEMRVVTNHDVSRQNCDAFVLAVQEYLRQAG